MHHTHNNSLVVLSVLIAIFASYTALDLANSLSMSRGKIKWLWLTGGSLAMGVGIWSMHFVGMLAFSLHGTAIYYNVPLLILSIVVAIFASAFTLLLITKKRPTIISYTIGSLTMGVAIAGMHYIGIWSMELPATISWDLTYVIASIVIAISSSFVALLLSFKLKDDQTLKGFLYRGAGGVCMGLAIAGMHYTAMMAMHFELNPDALIMDTNNLLATDGLASAVIVGTLLILGIALTGSNIDRALSRKTFINDTLEEAIRARDEFLSIASHELKTPLTSMKLLTQAILRNVHNNRLDVEKIQSMLESTDQSIDRINRLVDDMLDISRLNTGKLALQVETLDLEKTIKDVIERIKPLLQEAHCEIQFKSQGPVMGDWDKFRIEQVLTNLLSNATRYGPNRPVLITLETQDNKAIVRVKDHGKGIAPQDQERIFRRFERASNTHETRALGLGLFIVKEILNMHQGEIKVFSALGEGAEFVFSLPLKHS